MAEQERLTNKERREAARQERKAKEAEAARKAKKNQLRSTLITVVVVLVVGAVVFQAFFRGGGPVILDDTITIATEDAEAAREAAGCEVLTDRAPLEDRQHYTSAEAAPPEDTIYTDGRPTHSGPHNERPLGVAPDGFSSQVSEVSSTHNLEHGSVIVWYDPAQAGDQEGEITAWVELLNGNGFQEPTGQQAGAGIFRSPYEDPGITSGKAIAFRAWGTAMDCDTFDETVANAFVAENFGTRGIGPENVLAGYPDGVVEFSDREVDEQELSEPEEGDTGVEPADPEDAPLEGDEPAADGDEPAADGDEPAADGDEATTEDDAGRGRARGRRRGLTPPFRRRQRGGRATPGARPRTRRHHVATQGRPAERLEPRRLDVGGRDAGAGLQLAVPAARRCPAAPQASERRHHGARDGHDQLARSSAPSWPRPAAPRGAAPRRSSQVRDDQQPVRRVQLLDERRCGAVRRRRVRGVATAAGTYRRRPPEPLEPPGQLDVLEVGEQVLGQDAGPPGRCRCQATSSSAATAVQRARARDAEHLAGVPIRPRSTGRPSSRSRNSRARVATMPGRVEHGAPGVVPDGPHERALDRRAPGVRPQGRDEVGQVVGGRDRVDVDQPHGAAVRARGDQAVVHPSGEPAVGRVGDDRHRVAPGRPGDLLRHLGAAVPAGVVDHDDVQLGVGLGVQGVEAGAELVHLAPADHDGDDPVDPVHPRRGPSAGHRSGAPSGTGASAPFDAGERDRARRVRVAEAVDRSLGHRRRAAEVDQPGAAGCRPDREPGGVGVHGPGLACRRVGDRHRDA